MSRKSIMSDTFNPGWKSIYFFVHFVASQGQRLPEVSTFHCTPLTLPWISESSPAPNPHSPVIILYSPLQFLKPWFTILFWFNGTYKNNSRNLFSIGLLLYFSNKKNCINSVDKYLVKIDQNETLYIYRLGWQYYFGNLRLYLWFSL